MKFLEAQRLTKSADGLENKMLPGSRADQDGTSPPFRRGRKTEPVLEVDENITNFARSLNVDLTQVKGTGKNGAITTEDVQRVAGDNRVKSQLAIDTTHRS